MVNKTGDRVHRHRTSSPILNVNIRKQLIADSGSNCKNTINICLILTNPRIRKHRKSGIVISQMPNIKRLRVLRTHLTGNTRGLVTIISPRLLIAKDLIINDSTGRILNTGTLSKNLLVFHSLLADIGENRPIIIKAILTRPETLKALLVGMIITSDHNSDNKTVLSKRLGEIGMRIRSDGHTSDSTLCRLARSRGRLLHNLINVNGDTVTAEIFGTLEASIGRSHTEMRLENFNVTRTTTGVFLIELLNLKRHTKLIDRSTETTGRNSIKINRIKTGFFSRTTIASETSIIGTGNNR